MPDVSLSGIEYTIKGNADNASDAIDKLIDKLNELQGALGSTGTASNSLKNFSSSVKSVESASVTPLSDELKDLITNGSKLDVLRLKVENLKESLTNALNTGNESGAINTRLQIDQVKSSISKLEEEAKSSSGDLPLSQELQDLISNGSQIDLLKLKLENLKASLQEAFDSGNVSGAISIKSQINQVENSITKLQEAANSTGGNIPLSQDIQSLVSNASQVDLLRIKLANLQSQLQEAFNSGNLSGAISIRSQIDQVQNSIASATSEASIAKKIFSGFKTVLSGAGSVISAPFKQGISSVKSFTSGLSNLFSQMKRVAMYRILRWMIKQVTQAIKDGVNNLYGWSSLVNGKFKSSMDSCATSFTYLKNSLGAAVSPIIDSLAPAIDWLIDKIVALINVINQLFARLSGASSWTKAIKKTTEYSDAVSSAGGAAEDAIRYLAPFDELNRLPDESSSGGGSSGTDYSGMFEEVLNFSDDIANFADKLREAFENGDWQTLGTLLGDKVNEIVENIDWEGTGQKIGYWINSWFSTKYWTLDTINFTNIGSKIATLLNNALAEIDFEIIGRSMVQKFTKFGDTIVGFIEAADWGLIAKSAGDVIIGYFSEIGDWFQETDFATLASSIWKGIKDAVTNVDWGAVASSIFRAIGSALGAVASFVAQLGKDIMTDIWNAIVDAVTSSDYNGDGEITGLEIITGILTGIINALTDIKNWVREHIFEPLVDAVKSAFKIHSPSKEMETLGDDIGLGLLDGIKGVFTSIGTWCDEHILQPIKNAISGFDLKSLVFGGDGESTFSLDVAIKKVGDWGADVITAIGTKTETVKKTVKSAVEKASTWVKDAWDATKIKAATVKKTVQSAVTKASTWVKDAWTAAKTSTGTVTRTVSSAVKKASTWVSAAWSAAQTVAGTVKKTVESAVTKGTWNSEAWTVANWKKSTVTATVTANVQQGSTWSTTAYNLLTRAVSTITSTVKTILTDPKWKDNIIPTMKVKANFTSATYTGGAVTVPGKVMVNTTQASGGVYNNGSWSSIPQYASGTANAHGSLFIAGEAGAELVGHIGGRTEVLNRSQLAATMFAAVRSAIASTGFKVSGVSAAMANTDSAEGMNEDTMYRAMLRALNDSDVGDRPIELDGNTLYQSMVNRNRMNTRMTGVNALA